MAGESRQRKLHRDENFPVASCLIARGKRPHILAFYKFARVADDIADDPALTPEEKLSCLDGMEAVLVGADGPCAGAAQSGEAKAARGLAASLSATAISAEQARELLRAFRQDAVKGHYADWRELMAYCRYSAMPCGRYLLALHDSDTPAARTSADALSAALQILNHLQDCAADYRLLDRVYLPADWLQSEGATPSSLAEPRTSPALRCVFDRVLDGVTELIDAAAPLPRHIGDRRLALEAAVVLVIARKLSTRLRRGDPLAARVTLSRWDYFLAALQGILLGLRVGRHGG